MRAAEYETPKRLATADSSSSDKIRGLGQFRSMANDWHFMLYESPDAEIANPIESEVIHPGHAHDITGIGDFPFASSVRGF